MTYPLHAPKRALGFTLVEMMVVVVIASILLAVAVPMYQAQVRQSRRTDAKTALLDLAGREERYFSTSNTYSNTAATLGYTAFGIPVGSGYYQLNTPTITAAAGNVPASYTLTATAIGTQTADTSCQTFTVTSTGLQTSADGGGNDTTAICWQ